MLQDIVSVVAIAVAAALLWMAARRRSAAASVAGAAQARALEADQEARRRLDQADAEIAEKRAAGLAEIEAESRRRRQEARDAEERLREQDRNLGRRLQLLAQKQRELDDREALLKEREAGLATRERDAQSTLLDARQRLERLAGMTAAQARRDLIREIEGDARQEAAGVVRRIEEEAREEAGSRARRLVAEALQRVPTAEMIDNVVTPVRLPNDDMKGRIIGREGRNIRALEMATGVDLIVDETPEIILLSSYDPFRRAVARTAIERLIEDGRIHPARIEEVVARARGDMEEGLEAIGEAAAFDLGITGLPPRLATLLGRLKYRVVLGYNLLDHSLAVARLAQGMAALLGVPADTVKRAGLLHEIGHVEPAEGGVHPWVVSADLAARLGEEARVTQAIRSLNAAGPEATIDSVLLKTAESLVVSRPGERDQNLDAFIERLKQLETVAASFNGVSRAYAMRSGKEVRVIVEAGSVNDADVIALSKSITARIQKEVEYPGSVKVSVIRETRAVHYAT